MANTTLFFKADYEDLINSPKVFVPGGAPATVLSMQRMQSGDGTAFTQANIEVRGYDITTQGEKQESLLRLQVNANLLTGNLKA